MRLLAGLILLLALPAAAHDRWPEAGGGGSGSTFGMVGHTATEETLDAIYSLREIQAPTGILRTFYVDSFTGLDTNDGSEAHPWQTLTKVTVQAAEGHSRFRLNGTFSELVINQSADTGTCIAGEAATWTGASTGTIIDVDSGTGKVAIETATGADPVATNVITGTVSGCTRTVGTLTDTIGASGLQTLVARCESADDPCLIVESKNPSHPATINCNNTTSGLGAVIRACGDNTCSNGTGSVGWVVVQNVNIQACDTDNFKQVGDGKLVVLNGNASRLNNLTGTQQQQAFIAAHTGRTVWLNISADRIGPGLIGELLECVNQSSCITVSNKRLTWLNNTDRSAIEFSGKDHVMIGSLIDGGNAGGYGIDYSETVDPSESLTLAIARVATTNNYGGLYIAADQTGTTMDAKVYQFTSGIEDLTGIALSAAAGVADNALTVLLRGTLLAGQNLAAGVIFSAPDQDTLDAFVVDAKELLRDDSALTDDWVIGATPYSTLTLAQAAVPSDWNFWQTGTVLETTATDYPWEDTANTVVLADMGCHPQQNCWKTYDDQYTINLQSTTYIPAFVLGTEVRAFRLNGTDGNMGAR